VSTRESPYRSPDFHVGSEHRGLRRPRFRKIWHPPADSTDLATSAPYPPSPRRLEELDNAPRSQGEEQWSTVSKGALPKTVAKTVAKAVVQDPAAVTAAHATGHAFGALTKFMEPDDGDEDDETQQEEPSGALNVSDFKVSTPFFHVFEDTGKGVWCCVVTSPSGFDSAPVPITATVKRVGKLKPNSPPPTLEPEENTEVILDFKRRQKEERKKAAAEGGKKKKKKKKSPEEPETTSEVTVTEHHDVDKTELSKSIMNDLFAAPVYTAPIESAEVQREVSDKGNVFDAIQRENSRVLPDPPRERPRGVPPPPGLGGFVQPQQQQQQRGQYAEPPLYSERPAPTAPAPAPDSAAIMAQMSQMMQAQQGALISQQAAALEQAQAQMLAMQAQMATMQRQLEETKAREAAQREQRERAAQLDRDWRANAPEPNGAEALKANPFKGRGGGGGGTRATGGVKPNPFRKAGGDGAGSSGPPPGFEARQEPPRAPRDPNAYVPPALRQKEQ
jgi:hypothetical protein